MHKWKINKKCKMKIIHYIPNIDRIAGGTSTYMQVLGKELGKLAEVHVITHTSENPLPIDNCEIYYVSGYNPINGRFKMKLAVFGSNKAGCGTCELLLVACMRRCSAYGAETRLQGGAHSSWHVGALDYQASLLDSQVSCPDALSKTAILEANCLQATAESERDNLLKLGYNKNIKVVRLGIDAEAITMKSSWKKNRQILFLSRIHVKKGINFLVEAVEILREQLQGYKILVAGEGDAEYVAELKRHIAEKGLQNVVQLTGGVYGDEKWRLFQTSDFFVLPTHSENFGLAIAESLASGTPVITTVGTPWNDLNSSQSGAWIEIGTQPLVEALRKFLTMTDEELELMGRNGRKLIETKYSAKVMGEEMMEVYKSL